MLSPILRHQRLFAMVKLSPIALSCLLTMPISVAIAQTPLQQPEPAQPKIVNILQDPTTQTSLLESSLRSAEVIGDTRRQISLLSSIAIAYAKLDDTEKARSLIQNVETLAEQPGLRGVAHWPQKYRQRLLSG